MSADETKNGNKTGTSGAKNDAQETGATGTLAVIEAFGGIRPMAAKLKVPVTTVQGWKKRGAIPESRRDEIFTAAKKHNMEPPHPHHPGTVYQ